MFKAGTALALAIYNWLKPKYGDQPCFPRESETELHFGERVPVPSHVQEAYEQLRDFVEGIKKDEKMAGRLMKNEQPTTEELAEAILPPNNDGKYQILAKILAAIQSEYCRLMEFLSYFLRLAVISYQQLCAHYKTHRKELLRWADLLPYYSFWPKEFDLPNQANIVEQLRAIRPSLTRYVAEVLCKQGERSQNYMLIKQWFVSCYEEFGLLLFPFIGNCHRNFKRPDLELQFAAKSADYGTIAACAAAWALYACKKDSKSCSNADGWCTFHNDPEVTARIIGFANGLNDILEISEEMTKIEGFRIGYRAGMKLYDVKIESDDGRSPFMRKFLKMERKYEVRLKGRGNQPSTSDYKMTVPEAIEWPDREYDETTIKQMVIEMKEKLRLNHSGE